MCNVPERDWTEKIKSILNLCTGSLSYISILYKYFKNINVLEHSSFARPAMFLCLGITYIKINMIFYIMLVDTMSCMWLVGSHRLVCLLVWKNNKWGTHCHLPHSENEFCVICVCLRVEQSFKQIDSVQVLTNQNMFFTKSMSTWRWRLQEYGNLCQFTKNLWKCCAQFLKKNWAQAFC